MRLRAPGRVRPASPAPVRALQIQLALAGGTRYIGRVTAQGCAARAGVEPDLLLLTCDGLDHRIARAAPLSRAELERLAHDADPGAEVRFVRKPGSSRVAYARAADELPPEAPACSLVQALELLFPGAPGDRGLAVLALGSGPRPDVLILCGRSEEGEPDPSTVQIWLAPQDDVAALASEAAARGGFPFDADSAVRTQDDLLAVAARLLPYPRSRVVLGRGAEEWTALLGRGLALASAFSLALCIGAAWHLRAVHARLQSEGVRAELARNAVAGLLASHPKALARLAAIDAIPLLASARALWKPGSTTRILARPEAESIEVRWRVPVPSGPGAGPASPPDPASFAALVAASWSQATPAGFERGATLTGDADGLVITYRSQDARPGVARNALR